MFKKLWYFVVLLKILPCIIAGYLEYKLAKKDGTIEFKEGSIIAQNFISCVLDKVGASKEDREIVTLLFNSAKCKIKV